jgi:V-type H+-transporting ATPase subunit a
MNLMVDTFDIQRYKEINPGYFIIITFPFLFGVMLGDIGPNLFLFCFSVYLLINKKTKTLSKGANSMIQALVKERYFLSLMSIFSFYCGLIYNDFLSIPIHFNLRYRKSEINKKELSKDKECNYKFGLDPERMISNNELAFINPLKMKFSVIIGIFQMPFEIVLKGINLTYYS